MAEQKFGLFVAWMLQGGQQGFELCQSLLEMERHMIKKQEDEVWKFGVHRGLLVQTNSSCLQGSAHSFGWALTLQHILSGAGGL